MNESIPNAETFDAKALAALSKKLNVSASEVVEIYQYEFSRLHAQARVKAYIGVLAMSSTKNRLHKTAAHRC